MRINLSIPAHTVHPTDHMLNNALIELVKDVGSDGAIDVNKGKIFLERLLNRLYTCGFTCMSKFSSSLVD